MEETFPWIACTLVLKSLTGFFEKNIAIVGTVQKGRVGFPEEVFDTKNCEVLSKTCHFEKDKKDFYVFLHILCKQNQRVKRTL